VNVAGAALGEAREVTTTLEQGVRYRLVVSNRQGQQRQLGSIIPQNDRAFQLEITKLDFSFNQSSGAPVINTTATTSGSGSGTTKTLTVIFNDPANETAALSGTIHERGKPGNVLTQVSPSRTTFPLGRFKFETTVSGSDANTTYVFDYEYDRLGATTTGVEPFGGQQFDIGFDPGGGWGQIFGVGFLLVLGGVFIIPGAALLLYQLGFLTGATSLLGIGLAFSIAVAYNLVQTSGVVLGP
jgi:hypothetical protein